MSSFIIKNVMVQTMNVQNDCFIGWVLCKNGKIAEIGQGAAPKAETVIDGRGGVLTPGLIDIHTHLGLVEDGLGFEGEDCNEDTEPTTPHLRALDGINHADRCFAEAVQAGVTTVAVSPGSANPIGGQIALLKTAGYCVDDMLVCAPLAIKFALGENPKSVYHDKDETPTTRMATAAIIREQLFRAKEYLSRKQKSEQDDEDAPDFDMRLEALTPLLTGELQAHFHAHRADDICTALRISREFGLKSVIVHGTEAHLVAELLARDGVPVISGPFLTDRSKPELRHLTEASPAALVRAGVQTALTGDHPETPLRLMQTVLLHAVRAGMDRQDALRGVTAAAAEIIGMGQKIGSLQKGLDADLVLWSGDPLSFESRVISVWIAGKQVFGEEIK